MILALHYDTLYAPRSCQRPNSNLIKYTHELAKEVKFTRLYRTL